MSLIAKRGVGDPILEEGFDLIDTEEGAEVPRQGQDIPPESIRLEKVQDLFDVNIPLGGRRDRGLKLFEPFSGDLDGVDVFWRGDTDILDGWKSEHRY